MYFKNVPPKTLLWYRQSFHAFDGAMNTKAAGLIYIAQILQRNPAGQSAMIQRLNRVIPIPSQKQRNNNNLHHWPAQDDPHGVRFGFPACRFRGTIPAAT
jgi:hypothetical protein